MPNRKVVYVVEDDDAVRDSVTLLLESAEYVVEAFPSGAAFLEAVDKSRRGCVVLDVQMPHMTGIEVQHELKARGILFPVIVLTGQGAVRIAVQAMKAGAVEFLEKPAENDALLLAIDEAYKQLEAASAESERLETARALLDKLTQREMEVLRGLLGGLPNKLIAYALGISIRTVEIYRANVMQKLQARSLSTAVRLALAAGVEPLEQGVRGST